MATLATKKLVKVSKIFSCEKCDYNTSRKYNLQLHLNSIKHNGNRMATELVEISKLHKCEICNKCYNDRTGLWKHNKKCIQTVVCDSSNDNDEIILSLMKETAEVKTMLVEQTKESAEVKTMLIEQTKQNAELHTQVLAILKNGTHVTNNNNNTTFNLNLFLNEKCKDAMNLEDFINTVVWRLAELKMVGDMGFVKGVSKLIIDQLNLLSEEKRPIHCTDAKREVMYVKDSNKWEKECDGNPKLHRVVKRVSSPGLILPMLEEFRNTNPDYNVCESNASTQYQTIISETLCGDCDTENVDTIIKNISKEVLINKTK